MKASRQKKFLPKSNVLTLFSPAKINLFLKLINRREDGYHNLASLFQTIDLGDTLTLKESSHDTLICTYPGIPQDRTNLIWKAVDLFRKKTGIKNSLHITLEKKIPPQAGLAGGSSNGATILYGLNIFFKTNITMNDLATWSEAIGSDLPFFFSKGTAYCRGRGELVQEMPPLIGSGILVKPEEGLSTKEVFAKLMIENSSDEDVEKTLKSFYTDRPIYCNDLEKAAFILLPKLKKIKEQLDGEGVMTGSGTAFFCKKEMNLPFDLWSYSVNFINRSEGGWYR
ncbi:MAG: 4-(cytidine 5'-diphospho)-2-C-methyl-D-erythritol kinase [Chlamydiia bacterium]|nr:4-(cytidine 5'-diphospho)-2-C-methyl-D-erythritol kinase [Chlamydiia bacterium]